MLRTGLSATQQMLAVVICVCSATQSCLDSVILWTVSHQAPLSMGLPRHNTEGSCHFLLQGIP